MFGLKVNSPKAVIALMNFTPVSEQTFNELLDKCSVDERESILKYKQPLDQLRSLLAVIQIKYCWKKYFNVERELSIKKDKYGKPKVDQWIGDISISHSAEWIFTGISSEGKIGVDIESLNPFPFLEGTEELFLSEKELSFFRTIRNVEESKRYLLTLWTLKEAYLKEVGIGLTQLNLTSLSFNYNGKSKSKYFTYDGANGISILRTFDIDRATQASVSTSSIISPFIHYYRHDQKRVISAFIHSK
ncbi:4'-phosphopantetheinyl transferase superfamily protein [Cytobacillus depressus]|uniref:4'-phosphopantetheinyl transferase superfamily protein n=1 Tax=Cytobacillus depressus TaxID=1602942 RepID=A0A6L3V7N5_9BACI|nr:4'-phosphopantetheinyl transferase superfamily protein [Cytobacillus depressus]KAB2332153.1 4'-phosphopantetheinyl transferase superfamily protein [Cytobacillus depressus]